jgi:PadR family transcriptional regulator PadR
MEINSNINNTDLDLNAENIKAQMRKGVLEYCILSILRKGDSYVSPLIAELKAAKMIVVEGTLYPLLTRQKNQGLLSYRWEESPSGPPRKYYSLTEKGKKALEFMDDAWKDVIKTVELIKTGIEINEEE